MFSPEKQGKTAVNPLCYEITGTDVDYRKPNGSYKSDYDRSASLSFGAC